jgi:hypothetical protein
LVEDLAAAFLPQRDAMRLRGFDFAAARHHDARFPFPRFFRPCET